MIPISPRRSSGAGAFVILLMTVTALLAVLRWVPRPTNTYFWLELYNWGHIWLFAAVALLVAWCLRRIWPATGSTQLLAICALLCIALAGLSEVLQIGMPGRNADPKDFGRDIAGILAAMAGMYMWQVRNSSNRRLQRIGLVGVVLSALLLIAASWQLLQMIAAYQQRAPALPTLYSPDLGWSRSFVRNVRSKLSYASPPAGFADFSGDNCLHVRTSKRRYSGAEFPDLYADWTGYRVLALELFSSSLAPVPLLIRLDSASDPYAAEDWAAVTVPLAPGSNRVEIDLQGLRNSGTGMPFHRKHVYRIVVVTVDETTRHDLCYGDIELVE